MAKLVDSFEIETSTDWSNHAEDYERGLAKFKREARSDDEAEDSTVGEVVKFQVADGYAVYGVVSEEPLELCYIGQGDYYTIPDAHIRVLELADIKQLVGRERAINEMFARK